jgi:hypothetical protein
MMVRHVLSFSNSGAALTTCELHVTNQIDRRSTPFQSTKQRHEGQDACLWIVRHSLQRQRASSWSRKYGDDRKRQGRASFFHIMMTDVIDRLVRLLNSLPMTLGHAQLTMAFVRATFKLASCCQRPIHNTVRPQKKVSSQNEAIYRRHTYSFSYFLHFTCPNHFPRGFSSSVAVMAVSSSNPRVAGLLR